MKENSKMLMNEVKQRKIVKKCERVSVRERESIPWLSGFILPEASRDLLSSSNGGSKTEIGLGWS
jgi:hypothetical protein